MAKYLSEAARKTPVFTGPSGAQRSRLMDPQHYAKRARAASGRRPQGGRPIPRASVSPPRRRFSSRIHDPICACIANASARCNCAGYREVLG